MYKILIVDDEPSNLEVIVEYLDGENYQLLIAPNGKKAYELAVRTKPSLIIMDWDMPVMDGIEATRLIKNNPKTKDIPVVISSGIMIKPEHLETALQAGAVDYIRKPVEEIELKARVRSMLKLSESYKKIKSLNIVKDKFISIISHDLRNPFNVLIGFSTILLQNLEDYDKTKIRKFIELMHNTSKSAHKLLENMLHWSQTQTGTLSVNPEKINIKGIIKTEIALNETKALSKNIKLIDETADNIYIYADIDMISFVVRNLISNALKFTKKEGKVILKSKINKKHAEISVCDSGIGISEKSIKNLFNIDENFSRVGTDNEKGTGLGLIVCKEFIEKNLGEIFVSSEVGKGSEFTFTIPLAE